MAEKITDKLAAAARRVATDKATQATFNARRDANAQAERDRAERDRARETVQRRIIQQRIFTQVQVDAKEIADQIAAAGVKPDPKSHDGSRSIDHTHKDSLAARIHNGQMYNEESREWEDIPPHVRARLRRQETTVWPLAVTSVHEPKKPNAPGQPSYKKTGVGMTEEGDLMLFADGDKTRPYELVDLHRPRDTRGDPRVEQRREITPDDIVPVGTVELGVALEEQPGLVMWQERLVNTGAQVLVGVPVVPDWENK